MSLVGPFDLSYVGPSKRRTTNHEVYLGRFVQQQFTTEGENQVLDQNGDVARFLKGIFGDSVNLQVSGFTKTSTKVADHRRNYRVNTFSSGQRCEICKCNTNNCDFKGQASGNEEVTFKVNVNGSELTVKIYLKIKSVKDGVVFSEAESAQRRSIHIIGVSEVITTIAKHPHYDKVVKELKETKPVKAPKAPAAFTTNASVPVSHAALPRPFNPTDSLVVRLPEQIQQSTLASSDHRVDPNGDVALLLNGVFGEGFCTANLIDVKSENVVKETTVKRENHRPYYTAIANFSRRKSDDRDYFCNRCFTSAEHCTFKGQEEKFPSMTKNLRTTLTFDFNGSKFTVSFEVLCNTDVDDLPEYVVARRKITIRGSSTIVGKIEDFVSGRVTEPIENHRFSGRVPPPKPSKGHAGTPGYDGETSERLRTSPRIRDSWGVPIAAGYDRRNVIAGGRRRNH